jgi:hypothetical protein
MVKDAGSPAAALLSTSTSMKVLLVICRQVQAPLEPPPKYVVAKKLPADVCRVMRNGPSNSRAASLATCSNTVAAPTALYAVPANVAEEMKRVSGTVFSFHPPSTLDVPAISALTSLARIPDVIVAPAYNLV